MERCVGDVTARTNAHTHQKVCGSKYEEGEDRYDGDALIVDYRFYSNYSDTVSLD